MRKIKVVVVISMIICVLTSCGRKKVEYDVGSVSDAGTTDTSTVKESDEDSNEDTDEDTLNTDTRRFKEQIDSHGSIINIDAEVQIPEFKKYNTYSATIKEYTGEDLKYIAEDILGGTLYYYTEGKRPKEVLEGQLESLKESIDDEGIKKEYNKLLEEYNNAPDDWQPAVEYLDTQYAVDYEGEKYILWSSNENRGFQLYPCDNSDYKILAEKYDVPDDYDVKCSEIEMHDINDKIDDEQAEQCLSSAEQFISKLNIGDFTFVQYGTYNYYAIKVDEKYNRDLIDLPDGYCYFFVRSLNGVKVDGHSYNRMIEDDEFEKFEQEEYTSAIDVEDGFEIITIKNAYDDEYETINISVNSENQVVGFSYSGSVCIEDMQKSDVKIIDYETAKEIIKYELENNPPQWHGSALGDYICNYDNNGNMLYDSIIDYYECLELCYARIRDKKNAGQYMIIPVWCLRQNQGYDPQYAVMVNALDGSIIEAGDEQRFLKSDWW